MFQESTAWVKGQCNDQLKKKVPRLVQMTRNELQTRRQIRCVKMELAQDCHVPCLKVGKLRDSNSL